MYALCPQDPGKLLEIECLECELEALNQEGKMNAYIRSAVEVGRWCVGCGRLPSLPSLPSLSTTSFYPACIEVSSLLQCKCSQTPGLHAKVLCIQPEPAGLGISQTDDRVIGTDDVTADHVHERTESGPRWS